jgi:hypothetical protein
MMARPGTELVELMTESAVLRKLHDKVAQGCDRRLELSGGGELARPLEDRP